MKARLPTLNGFPPPPGPADVLYVSPTGTEEGRRCGNCVLWDKKDGRCVIHRKSVRIGAGMVCGYHVYGTPLPAWVDLPGIQPVEPATSGLIAAPEGGTACGNCAAFQALGKGTGGFCTAVGTAVNDDDETWKPAQVDAYGCCSRWTAIT